MPLTSQRRNTAYLNCAIRRFGWENCDIDDPVPRAFPDLRFISEARSNSASDSLIWAVVLVAATMIERRGNEGPSPCDEALFNAKRFVRSNVELSGAHAGNSEWHFIHPASARTMC